MNQAPRARIMGETVNASSVPDSNTCFITNAEDWLVDGLDGCELRLAGIQSGKPIVIQKHVNDLRVKVKVPGSSTEEAEEVPVNFETLIATQYGGDEAAMVEAQSAFRPIFDSARLTTVFRDGRPRRFV